jgi:hypothetical protein
MFGLFEKKEKVKKQRILLITESNHILISNLPVKLRYCEDVINRRAWALEPTCLIKHRDTLEQFLVANVDCQHLIGQNC